MLPLLFFFLFLLSIAAVFGQPARPSAEDAEPVVLPNRWGWAALVVLLGYQAFAYEQPGGIGWGVFNLAVLAGWWLLVQPQKRSRLAMVITAVSAFASVSLAWRANGFVQSVNGVTMVVSLGLLLALHAWSVVSWQALWLGRNLFRLVGHIFIRLGAIFKNAKGTKLFPQVTMVSLIKTVALTLGVGLFFLALLTKADPIFAQLVRDIQEQVLERVLISVILLVIVVIAASLKLATKVEDQWRLQWLSFADVLLPTVVTAIIFGAFLLVQLKYLFGGHADLSVFELTYSEYVRKGFLELMIASFVGGVMVYMMIAKQRLLAVAQQIMQLRVIASVLLVELAFLLFSAFKRDMLYVDVYGLSRVRIIGGLFLLWLLGTFALLAVLNWRQKMSEQKVWQGLLALTVGVVLALNVINIDHIIAAAPAPEGRVRDYFYINNLSEDAINGWQSSIADSQVVLDGVVAKESLDQADKNQLASIKLALMTLQQRRDYLTGKYASTIELRTANASEHRAYQVMQSQHELFYTQLDQLIERIEAVQNERQLNLFDEEYSLMFDYHQPFMDLKLQHYPRTMKFEDPSFASPSPSSSPRIIVD